jgi:hypothetical protein
MFMRSIAYIAILALAATQGMGISRDLRFFALNPRFQSIAGVVAIMILLSDVTAS